MTFRLLSYFPEGGKTARAGVLGGETVADLEAALAAVAPDFAASNGIDPASTFSILQAWDAALPVLEKAAAAAGDVDRSWPLDKVHLAAPIHHPSSIFCAAANYQDHFLEMSGHEVDKSKINPYFFNKVARQTIIGTGAEIRKPPFTSKMDWEAEIVAVIGRTGHNVKAADALDLVAGYTIINDLSAREFMSREDWPRIRSDWVWQKSFDTSAPMGPWITPSSEIPDPQNLKINTWVNGQLEQDTHSKYMVFTVAEQIEALSQHLTLMPGDVIATGTGGGVGHPKGRFLNPGDVCRIEIEGLGTIENPVVAGD